MFFLFTGITNSLLYDTLHDRPWGVDTHHKMNFITGFECHVCDRIHEDREVAERGADKGARIATGAHYGCGPPTKYDLPPPAGDEGWERDLWTWEYERAGENLRKLFKALKR